MSFTKKGNCQGEIDLEREGTLIRFNFIKYNKVLLLIFDDM